MMLQYQSYIFKNLLVMTGMVLLGLTGIVWLMQALKLVDFIVNQGIPIWLFLKLSVLLMPSLVMMVLPVALCIALIFLYHRLKIESELVVLQSAGLSRFQLAAPALMVAFCATLIGYIISFYILPISSREFRDMQFYLRNNYVSVLLQEGVFSSPVPGLTVYVRERSDDKNFKGILVDDSREEASQVTMMAEQATLVDGPHGPEFLLINGNRQERRDGKLSFLAFDSYVLDINFYTQSMETREPDSEEQSIGALFSRTPEQSVSMKAFMKERAEAHQRILWPAMSLTLSSIVSALILSGTFNRRQRWQRNVLTSGASVALILIMVSMRGAMGTNAGWVYAAYAFLLLPLIISFAALFPVSDRFKAPHLKGA